MCIGLSEHAIGWFNNFEIFQTELSVYKQMVLFLVHLM